MQFIIGGIFGALVVLVVIFKLMWRVAEPNEALIISGLREHTPTDAVSESLGFKIVATGGTLKYLQTQGVAATKINKVSEGRPHIVDAIKNGGVQLVFNTTDGTQAFLDSKQLRRAALLHKVPYYTTLAGSVAAAQGIRALIGGDLQVRALQDYFPRP